LSYREDSAIDPAAKLDAGNSFAQTTSEISLSVRSGRLAAAVLRVPLFVKENI
jgi:hypothetical protein